jgi:hypothetical protein
MENYIRRLGYISTSCTVSHVHVYSIRDHHMREELILVYNVLFLDALFDNTELFVLPVRLCCYRGLKARGTKIRICPSKVIVSIMIRISSRSI